MNYEIHTGAEEDFQWALVYYGARSAQLKLRFEAEVESLVRRICDAPQRYAFNHPPDIGAAGIQVNTTATICQ